MNLSLTPETVELKEMHYIFVEKKGHFMDTAPKSWQELHQKMEEIKKQNNVLGALSLYKIQPEMTYRAGVSVDKKPTSLPQGLEYFYFKGGKYSKFVLKGSYAQLPEACGKVFETIQKTQLPLREDFFIENYVNDPSITPEEQLITEILIPTK